jgi:hypothetical protein
MVTTTGITIIKILTRTEVTIMRRKIDTITIRVNPGGNVWIADTIIGSALMAAFIVSVIVAREGPIALV